MNINIDRAKAPASKEIELLELPNPAKEVLDNGIPLYTIHSGKQDIIKLDIYIKAGTAYQPKKLVAAATNKLLKEGTKSFSSETISRIFDHYGVVYESIPEKDYSHLSFYMLNRYFDEILPIIAEMLFVPVFPQKEFEQFILKSKQQFIVNMEQVRFIAQMKFNNIVYGDHHPYGQTLVEEDFEKIERQDIKKFHQNYYSPSNIMIFLAGDLKNNHIKLANQYLGGFENKPTQQTVSFSTGIASIGKKVFINKPGVIQNAFRVGKVLFNTRHPDFMGLKVLNMILGGYFGSRLMSNIREEKGYTYGIYSMLITMQQSGYMFIASETGTEVTNLALKEVYKEIDTLCNNKVPGKELMHVKNYMIGALLRKTDGPFEQIDRYKEMVEYGFTFDYLRNYISYIKQVQPGTLLNLAQKYLHANTLSELVVGT